MELRQPERHLGVALVGYLMASIAVVTLAPFSFQWPAQFRLIGFVSLADLVANIVFFIPLGFFVAFAGGRALFVGLLVSVLMEVGQQFIPGRYPSWLDVLTNGLGSWLGGIGYQILRLALGATGQALGVRALDLPLMGTVYLLVPLLWVSGLLSAAAAGHESLTLLPLVAGVVVFGSVDRHHFRAQAYPIAAGPLFAAGWALIAMVPAWYHAPTALAVGVMLVAAGTYFVSRLLSSTEPAGRRYEVPTVWRATWPLLTFLALAAVGPLDQLAESWRGSLGWAEGATLSPAVLLGLVELLAAATVLGFALAEGRGRVVESAIDRERALGVAAVALAGNVELLRGWNGLGGASLLEGGLIAAATWFGGRLYLLQRAYVVALLGRTALANVVPDQGRMTPPLPALGAPK